MSEENFSCNDVVTDSCSQPQPYCIGGFKQPQIGNTVFKKKYCACTDHVQTFFFNYSLNSTVYNYLHGILYWIRYFKSPREDLKYTGRLHRLHTNTMLFYIRLEFLQILVSDSDK